jgi:hypothetical protein
MMNVMGTRDGAGAGDHDEPYRYGRLPRVDSPWPFTPWQYARLLRLRGRVRDNVFGGGDLHADDPSPASPTDDQHPTLFYSCMVCQAMVPGAHQRTPCITCPVCAPLRDRDLAAHAILTAAGLTG